MSGIRLEVFKNLFAAIPEEMGIVLRKSSYSPNIKERRDFSCALFDRDGRMISQAAHIPVHLGSMPLSVLAAIETFQHELQPGDMVLLNDPFRGGTHLPDITLVTPVFLSGSLAAFVASRAHHADVGGMAAGSMPLASEIYQEGIIIPPLKLFSKGELNRGVWDVLLANVRTPEERQGDLWAQVAANRRGCERFIELVHRYGEDDAFFYMNELLAYTERMTRRLLADLPDGVYTFCDQLDEDGISPDPVPLRVAITIQGDQAVVDFSGSSPQRNGPVNAVYAITLSAVYYVFRCLVRVDVPNNAGCLAPIQVIAPPGSVVNALPPAAVSAGNVETSQRIVDVVLGAMAQAAPGCVPAASQGTMNNLTIGGVDRRDPSRPKAFAYYETIAGGTGARPGAGGLSGVHSHMTNTLNTPVEALEFAYPLRVLRYEIRLGTGGHGRWTGGNGLRRDIQVLVPAQANIISERRRFQPYGLSEGESGEVGENFLIRGNREIELPGKGKIELEAGDILSIRTPGGGGFGKADADSKN